MPDSNQVPLYIADCPRCGHAKTTFDVLACSYTGTSSYREEYECFLRCRSCFRSSIAHLRNRESGEHSPTKFSGIYIQSVFDLKRWVFEIPGSRSVPDHVPGDVGRIFKEGANCVAIGAWDAAGAMFRKVLDVSTRELAPDPDSSEAIKTPNWKVYKDLRLRLDWLFANGRLNRSLEDLSSCIHQDGNDAAHDVFGIGREEAEDLSDFADQILRLIYTLPGQIDANKERRNRRRAVS